MHPSMDFTFPTPGPTAQSALGALPHPFKQEEDNSFSTAGIFDTNDDHRRRRRNRTTQSCWSCHQAKRRCDRKRPCSRCIQLGLTGLCVYETDDPASRDDPSLSETQRLRNRIAELEKLVRELKNKPHPKWAGPGGMFKGGSGTTNGSPGSGSNGSNGNAMDTDSGYPSSSNGAGYRFPPLNTLGVPLSLSLDANGNSTSTNGTGTGAYSDPNGSYYGIDNRRPSLVSNASTNTGNSSPRTPYMGYYSSSHQNGHAYSHSNGYGSNLSSNPCGCLASITSNSSDESNMDIEDSTSASSTTVANRLARAIRSVILESGVAHPFAEGCKVLALVRELENIASSSTSVSQSSQSTNGTYTAQSQTQTQANGSGATTSTQQQQPQQAQTQATQNYAANSYFSALSAGSLAHTTGGHSPPPPSLTPSTSTTGTTASSPSSYASHTHSHTHSHHPHQHPHQHLSHLGVTSTHPHHPHHTQQPQPPQQQPQAHATYLTHHDSSERSHPHTHSHSHSHTHGHHLTNGYSSYTAAGYYSTGAPSSTNGTTSPSLSPPTGLTVLGVQTGSE